MIVLITRPPCPPYSMDIVSIDLFTITAALHSSGTIVSGKMTISRKNHYRIKHIFSGVYLCITWTNSLTSKKFVSNLVQVIHQ